MEWIAQWSTWHWLILGFILLILEVAVPGIFFLWWGLSAMAVAGIHALFPALSTTTLVITYALLALVLSLLWWRYQHRQDVQDQRKSSLNQRDHAMLGATGKVQEINANGIGRGAFGDTTWRIQGVDLSANDVVEVVAVDGITLQVRKIQ